MFTDGQWQALVNAASTLGGHDGAAGRRRAGLMTEIFDYARIADPAVPRFCEASEADLGYGQAEGELSDVYAAAYGETSFEAGIEEGFAQAVGLKQPAERGCGTCVYFGATEGYRPCGRCVDASKWAAPKPAGCPFCGSHEYGYHEDSATDVVCARCGRPSAFALWQRAV